MSPLVKFSHKFSPLFNRFSIFDKNVNLSKNKPGSTENFFLVSPSLKYLDFYDVPKNSEHINTFRGARLKSHPSKFRSLTFQNKRKPTPKTKKFPYFFHNGERNLLPKSHREKDNLIKLIQIFQRYDFENEHMFSTTP